MVYVTHIYMYFLLFFCFNDYNICIYTYKCVYVCIYVLYGYVQMLAKCWTNVVIKYNKKTKYIKCRLLLCQNWVSFVVISYSHISDMIVLLLLNLIISNITIYKGAMRLIDPGDPKNDLIYILCKIYSTGSLHG